MNKTAQEKLLLAMEQLLQCKPLDAIRVSELVRQAGVCRKTFYRHYQDKYALAAAYFADFLTARSAIVSGESFDVALLEYLAICEEKAALLKTYTPARISTACGTLTFSTPGKPIRTIFWKRARTHRILPCSLPLRSRSAAERIW